MLYAAKLSLLLLCSVVTNTNAQTFATACGGLYTTTASALTIDAGAQECLYSFNNSQVAITGTSQTISSAETVAIIVPTTTGAISSSLSNTAFVNYYKSARSIALFVTTAASSTLTLTYSPTIPTGTTETTLSTTSTCGGIISTYSGQITQPSGSSAMSCYWIFSAPSNSKLSLTISDVVATGGACTTDYLQINNFTTTNTRSVAKYCTGMVTGGTISVNPATVIRYVAGSTGSGTLTFKIAYTVTLQNGARTIYNFWTMTKTFLSLTGLIYLGKAIQL